MSHPHFQELKEWSARKHELLRNYLEGFVKILGGASSEVVYYIDGFAGPGLYEDGQKGSPLLAAEYANELAGRRYQLRCINVEIDPDLYANLVENTKPFSAVITNLSGAFGGRVDQILGQISSRPAIFFLDPFGIKGIEWKHLSKILKRRYKTELLLRVNPTDLQRLAGFSDSESADAPGKRDLITQLLGFPDSKLWEQVWLEHGAEGLVNLYLKRIEETMSLASGKAFVYRYPIRSIEGDIKYYLVFATRHPKGAILMNDIVYGVIEQYEHDVDKYEATRLRQLSLFQTPEPTEEEVSTAKVEELKKDIWSQFQGKTARSLDIREAMLMKWFGRIKGAHFTRAFSEMSGQGFIKSMAGRASDDKTSISFSS